MNPRPRRRPSPAPRSKELSTPAHGESVGVGVGVGVDLARQLRRAATSVPLNVSEGMYSRGKNRAARYHTAMGSAREVLGSFEVACAMGYVDSIDSSFIAKMNHIIGTLVRLLRL